MVLFIPVAVLISLSNPSQGLVIFDKHKSFATKQECSKYLNDIYLPRFRELTKDKPDIDGYVECVELPNFSKV